MLDHNLLTMIGEAISPANNVRFRLTRELFDRSLNSQMPFEVEMELILPTLEYELTISKTGWMYFETLKYGVEQDGKELVVKEKTYHSRGSYTPQGIRHSYYGTRIVRVDHLYNIWPEFMGYDIHRYDAPEVDLWEIPIYQKDGFYSVGRNDVRYLFDNRDKSRVVRAQYLFPDGGINFETIHDIKKFDNGVWFQMGYDMIRYADPKTGREARYHRCVRVTDIEFDIEFDAKTFELPEGVDAVTRPT